MNKCELCKFPATSYCESDDAHLCWTCDAKVHAANFLVARHTRTLLCRNCQSLTPWKASGPDLGRTVSFCHNCINGSNSKAQRVDLDESEADNEEFTDDDDDLSADSDGVKGENQVVPPSPTTPPPAASLSSSSYTSSQDCVGRLTCVESSVDRMKSLKWRPDDNGESSSRRTSRRVGKNARGGGGGGEATAVDSPSRLKVVEQTPVKPGSRSGSNIKREESETVDLSLRRNVRRRMGGSFNFLI